MAQGPGDFISEISIKHGLGCFLPLISPRAGFGHQRRNTFGERSWREVGGFPKDSLSLQQRSMTDKIKIGRQGDGARVSRTPRGDVWTLARTRCILSSCLHPWTPASKNLALGEVSGGQQRRRGSALCFSSPFSAFLEEGVASTTQGSGVWEPFLWEPASPHGWRRRRAWARRSGPGGGSRQGMRSGVQVTDRENWLGGGRGRQEAEV